MKFTTGQDTLSTLTKKTSGSSDELTGLLRQLAEASAPVEATNNGHARRVFDTFKENVDGIAAGLNRALSGVLQGVSGMDRTFQEGQSDMAEQTQSVMGSTNFDAARFAGRS